MPQLSPAPWFMIMLLTWLTLMTLALNKTLKFHHPNNPNLAQPQPFLPPTWMWPWF